MVFSVDSWTSVSVFCPLTGRDPWLPVVPGSVVSLAVWSLTDGCQASRSSASKSGLRDVLRRESRSGAFGESGGALGDPGSLLFLSLVRSASAALQLPVQRPSLREAGRT